jgi:acetyl esterase/lipase
MRHSTFLLFVFFVLAKTSHAQTDSVYLWSNAVPNQVKPKGQPVITTINDGTTRVTEVTNPFFAVFEPKKEIKNNKAVIVCPGGGYVRLAVIKEGYSTANWLAGLGYTVFVLHYRVPNAREGAVQDIQRAIRLVRYNANKYGIDPNKIGAMGFSAGAHVAAKLGMSDSTITYPAQDAADAISGKPNALIIMYPGYLDGGPNKSLSPDLNASAKTPDTFIFQAMDDGIVQSSFALAAALRDVKANVELHIVPQGGHGYGMTPGNKAAEAWPRLLAPWLKEHL